MTTSIPFHFETAPAFTAPKPRGPHRTYRWLNHRVTVATPHGLPQGKAECATCSVPLVIAEAIEFMARRSVAHLVIDGQSIDWLI